MAVTYAKSDQWRVIVRFSLDYDRASAVRNALAPVLTKCGIARTKTGTWQSKVPHCAPGEAAKQLAKILKILSDPQGQVGGASAHAKLDHIWFYIERTR